MEEEHTMSKGLADKLVTMHHANLSNDDGSPRIINVVVDKLFAWYRGPDASTFVVCDGGAVVPVRETPEEVTKLWTKVQEGEKTDGKK